MTPLLERMNEDMKLVGYSQRTQDTYLYAVRKVTNHFQKSPDQITNEELRKYLLWHKDKYAPNTTTIALCGIKFYYQKILKKPMPVFDLARQPRGQKLPVDNGMVNVRYQCSQTGRWNVCRLKALEFLRRYLQHVLPRGFVKVRYYGLYGHRHRERLNTLRETLDQPASDKITPSSEQADTSPSESVPATPSTCRHCGGQCLPLKPSRDPGRYRDRPTHRRIMVGARAITNQNKLPILYEL